ncbi:hypothetical protein Tco_1443439, partial [Tanacetum coccineum]
FERNWLKAANFPLRICISLSVVGGVRSEISLTFEGLALIPCLVMRCPRNVPSSTLKERFFVLSFMLMAQSLSKAALFCSGAKTSLLLFDWFEVLVLIQPVLCIEGLPFYHNGSLDPRHVNVLVINYTTIPIFFITVLSSSRLRGELDLTMTKFKISVLVKGLSPTVISRGTSLRGQECSPKKPTRDLAGTISLSPFFHHPTEYLRLSPFPSLFLSQGGLVGLIYSFFDLVSQLPALVSVMPMVFVEVIIFGHVA